MYFLGSLKPCLKDTKVHRLPNTRLSLYMQSRESEDVALDPRSLVVGFPERLQITRGVLLTRDQVCDFAKRVCQHF